MNNRFTDQTITCVDCGEEFQWTAKEQGFYAERGFTAPKRCKECRKKKKLERQSEPRRYK